MLQSKYAPLTTLCQRVLKKENFFFNKKEFRF